jgi:molecular chaperone GrpE
MDNFRKRQTRRADEAILTERERLLSLFLPAVDNLSRALNHDGQTDETLRQGVALTHRELLRLLESEGVTPLETVGQPFDPEWHEAVSVVPAEGEPDTIVAEIEAGYKLADKLLRPAKVVVAA